MNKDKTTGEAAVSVASTKLADFKKLQKTLDEQMRVLEAMKNDPDLQAEEVFSKKLHAFLKKHGRSVGDAMQVLNPLLSANRVETLARATNDKKTRYIKPVRRFVNPHTGQVVLSKSGSSLILNRWKAQFGADEVKSWADK